MAFIYDFIYDFGLLYYSSFQPIYFGVRPGKALIYLITLMITPIQTVPVSMQIQSHYWFDMYIQKTHWHKIQREGIHVKSKWYINIFKAIKSTSFLYTHNNKIYMFDSGKCIPNVQILKANINKWSNKLLYTIIDLYLPAGGSSTQHDGRPRRKTYMSSV